MIDNNQRIKEFFNLNGFYLRLHLTSQQLSLISYNSNLLDGIKYECIFNLEDIQKNDKINNLTLIGLYDLICNKIRENKIMIKNDQNSITLLLLENIAFNPNTDIIISLIRKNKEYVSEYENVLSNVIMNLKEENKNMRNEINELKNLLKVGNNINNNNINNINRQSFAEVKVLKNQPINQSNINLSQSQNLFNNSIPNQIPNQLKNLLPGKMKNSISGPLPEAQIGNQIQNKPSGLSQAQLNAIMNNNKNLKIMDNLNIDSLSKLNYPDYPKVIYSSNSFSKIAAYAVNSYHGIFKKENEDKTKEILDYKTNKTINNSHGEPIIPNISYFAIYDGHGGNKCSEFLKNNFDSFLFNSNFFPMYTLQAIYEAFMKSEQEFNSIAFDSLNGKMLDKSGSCALSTLFINEWCFVSYLGDSRGLLSFDSGNQLYQITRDHKPNDPTEKGRIEKAGGRIFKDTRLRINGQKVHVNEESLPGFKFPFRVVPGNLSVSFFFNILILGGENNRRFRLEKPKIWRK